MKHLQSSPRYEMDALASYQCAELEGEATIANISTSGALLEPASTRLPLGTPLYLRITRLPSSPGLEISSEVVRATDSGFAVRFKNLDPEVGELLSELLPIRRTDPGSTRSLARASTVPLPRTSAGRHAMAIAGLDLDALSAEAAISTVSTLSRIRTGSLHVNRVSIFVNVESDSFYDIVVRINRSGARAAASFDATAQVLSIASQSSGETLVLEDGTSGFFSSVNLIPGALEAAEASARPAQRTLYIPPPWRLPR